ncbi:unnamed protein product [Cylindrotheca closterium]|uniref:Uncharacterized protein n=1 Tax=Cylindrotheca closterium TaxID=2856 RepID=A0AAD2FIA3_9STRA|nr:unnamed protein product [Cylindrotheca closterium]
MVAAPASPMSTVTKDEPNADKERQLQDLQFEEAGKMSFEEDLDFDSSSIVNLEMEANSEWQMFADLSELVHSVENTFDTVTIASADLSEIHLNDSTDEIDGDDDDDLENEWAELSRVEGLVRKELEKQRLELGISPVPNEKREREHTLYDHYKGLKMEEVKGIGFVCDKSQFLEILDKPSSTLTKDCVEFCQPLLESKLEQLYFGIESVSRADSEGQINSTLPFRTVAFRIRPDKLSGAIMDSVCNAVALSSTNSTLNLLKRQGRHLRAVVANENIKYVIDAQLCITRNGGFQRQLLLRLYYPTEQELVETDLQNTTTSNAESELRDTVIPSNNHLKEACALLQLMHRLELSGNKQSLDKPFSTFRRISYETASSNLRTKFRKSESVKAKRGKSFFKHKSLLLPALSKDDWLLLQASWPLVENIWDGLSSTFTQSSLHSSSLERLNQIPCLDVHFCMDLFRLSEELMITDLERAKANLRQHNEKGRYISNIFTHITKPMFEMYSLKQVEELQETMTDFDVPRFDTEDSIFMSLASQSLESSGILNKDNTILQSDFQVSQEAVQEVCSAYHSYHSDIQSKFVKYMTSQVQKTLYRYRFCIHETYKRLKNAYRHSELAVEESNKFLDLMQQAKNLTSEGTELAISPFLKCQVDGGECYVTETHLLLHTNKLYQQPSIVEWFHQSSALLFQLSDIQVKVKSQSHLQISTKEGEEMVQFSPNIPVERLHLFISIMQSLQHEKIDMVGVV